MYLHLKKLIYTVYFLIMLCYVVIGIKSKVHLDTGTGDNKHVILIRLGMSVVFV